MAGVYGISRHDVIYIKDICCSFMNEKSISINAIDKKTKILLITDIKKLLTLYDKIVNSELTVFVFGSPIFYKRYSIHFLDKDCKLTKEVIKTCVDSTEIPILKRRNVNIAKSLLKKSKPSIIKNILTELYKIQDKAIRDKLKRDLFIAIVSSCDVTELKETLISLSVKETFVTRILNRVDGDILERTLKAVNESRKYGNVKDAARKYNISSYDIRYILSQKKS